MKKDKQKKIVVVPAVARILNKRSTVIILLAFICILGIPFRAQNMKLDGYISDDAWWHFRQISQVIDFGHRLNPDPCEFATLARPMTYPPLFHYAVAYSYKAFGRGLPLVKFTNFFNLFEAIMYILLIYFISYLICNDKISSLIGALAASVSYGLIIRARAGELMPFVLGDLFALIGVVLLLYLLRNLAQGRAIWLALISGVMMGLSLLAWNGGVFIYLPLVLFIFIAVIISKPRLIKRVLLLFSLCLATFLVTVFPWYLPFLLKFGISPHSKEMEWFMKGFTVLHQVKPLNFYILTSGIAIFFIPLVFFGSLLKREAVSIFFNLWVVLGIIATYVGWRGYVAVVPIISAIALSIGVAHIMRFLFKEKTKNMPAFFLVAFILVYLIGAHISGLKLAPLDPQSPNEVRTNERSTKMLKFLKQNYPQALTIDHITWISEDAAVGSLRMVAGQYLEYLPQGSSEVLKDMSRAYIYDEENAYKIFKKYNVDLIIVRKQLLQLPQLSLLFAPPELRPEEYLNVIKENGASEQITINFTPKGMQTMLFRMLNRHKLSKFELVYTNQDKDDSYPFVVVYKAKKE